MVALLQNLFQKPRAPSQNVHKPRALQTSARARPGLCDCRGRAIIDLMMRAVSGLMGAVVGSMMRAVVGLMGAVVGLIVKCVAIV